MIHSYFRRFLCGAAAAVMMACTCMTVSAVPDEMYVNRMDGWEGNFSWECCATDTEVDLNDLITLENHSNDEHDSDGAFSLEWGRQSWTNFMYFTKGRDVPPEIRKNVPLSVYSDVKVESEGDVNWGLDCWLEQPAAEMIIVQNYLGWCPPGYLPEKKIAVVMDKGIRYDVYRNEKHGNTPFGADQDYWQYWFVPEHRITEPQGRQKLCVNSYVQALDELGLQPGRLYHVDFFLDIIHDSGRADVSELHMFWSELYTPKLSILMNRVTDPQPIPGDLDGDWCVTEEDLDMMVAFLLGETLETDEYMPSKEVMDISDDGTVNAIDLTLLKRYLLT